MLKTEARAEGADVEDAEAEGALPAAPAESLDSQESASPRGRVRIPRPRWTTLAAVAIVLAICALLAASALMFRQHLQAQADERNRAEFVAAARQVVVTLMSIDFKDPQAGVQRIIDNSTGSFREEFQAAADDFTRLAKDAKVTTKATANAAAVESMTPDTAVVMVAASSTVTNATGAAEEPRSWRLVVDLKRDGAQIKMSKVEFVA